MRLVSAAVIAFLALAVASVPRPGLGQTAQPDGARRPRIGLVLSGGGARGGAELGVIKALEELHVPIDVITGTSIGAAIGGLYASGMSVKQIEDFVDGIDWDAAFLNKTPRRLESFRRKREDDLFLLQQQPGLGEKGLTLPAGVVQGQVIDMIMSRITLPVAEVDNFDNLTIPFRAVAGDLETGEAVVLGSGNLALAIRASMAVPAALTPVELGGRLLVDGGIAMNLPVEVAKAMGAERIIAVDISEKLKSRDEIKSVVDVTGQLTGLLTASGMPDQLKMLTPKDVLLQPDLSGEFSSVGFSRLAEAIQPGYDFAMAHREELEPFALSPEDYAAWRASLPNPRRADPPTINYVDLGDTKPLAPSVIEARIQDIKTGEPLDLDKLEKSLYRVYGLNIYQNVRYNIVDKDDLEGLKLDFIERSWGPSYVQLGLRYSSATDEDALFGVAASYLRTGINELGGEWRTTFLLGDDPGFFADWYQPLGSKALNFINPALDIESTSTNLFTNGELAAEARFRSATLELGGGREFLDWGELRGGFRVGAGDTKLHLGDPAVVPYDSFHRGEIFSRFSVDTLDNISFPRHGTYATFEWRGSSMGALGADHDYGQMLVSTAHAWTWGRHTVLSTLRYDATVSGESPAYSLFRIGGFRDLSGLNNHELSGQIATRIGASYYRRIGDLALFPAFVGFSAEVGNAWQSRRDISLNRSIWGGAIWAGVDTPAGPVFLAYGSAEGGDHALYVVLGRLF